jgi:hypothetical protein
MNPFSRYPRFLAAAALGAAVFISACASVPPPTDQMAVSKVAIANAVSAGGSEYAPDDLRHAQDKMDLANKAMQKEDYDVARRLAEEAQVDARLAEKKAQAAKAQKAALVMREDNRALRDEINRK